MDHHVDVGFPPFVNGDDEQLRCGNSNQNYEEYDDNVDDGGGGNETRHSINDSSRDSSAGKLFVGGIAWETSEESFSNYFSNFGELTDSVIMMDKISGRPRGFGFVTFADSADADKVLEQDHVIDGRSVEVKRTVPREEMQVRGVSRTKKIFVGGIPATLTEEELREYFSSYGEVIEHQIMLDHVTGRSRGFGFVTFDSEEAVDKILVDGQLHELGGKQVEIKRAEPKRAGGDFSYDNRLHRGGGSGGLKSYGGFGRGLGGYGGKAERGYDEYGGGYGGYGGYGGGYGAGSAGFYGGYGGYGYGFGFGGPMYGAAAYAGGGYGGYGGGRGYGSASGGGGGYSGKGFGRVGGGGDADGGDDGGYGYGYGYGYDGSKGYDNGNGGGGGGGSGRFHPYRK